MEETYKYIVATQCTTYNHSLYIEDTLNGFAMQRTELPAIYIVTDDASPDNAAEVIRRWAEGHLDMEDTASAFRQQKPYGDLIGGEVKGNSNAIFRILLLKENHFQAGKEGLMGSYMSEWLGQAKYMALCEGDDYWIDPLKQQKQIDFLDQHPDYGLCITDFKYRYDTNSQLSKAVFGEMGEFRPTTFREHLVNAGYIGPMTWMFRRPIFLDAVSKSHTDGTLAIALEFFARSKVGYLDEAMGVYRTHAGSATTQTDPVKKFRYTKGVFDVQIEYALRFGEDKELVDQLKMQGYTTNMLNAVEAGDEDFVKEATEYYRSKGMEMRWFVEKCREYVGYKKKYEKIYASKAYRLGKRLLKPFKKNKKES